ncbi:MAG: CoA transferase [Pseudomonadota bacterium]
MGALDGVKVIDLTRVLGGPFAAQWLGDHGADVIKVEPPGGDETRHWGPPFDETTQAASYFNGANRNKRGMALDLRQEAGREVLERLLHTADVLIENFKPGTLGKWCLGDLEARFPRLIHCQLTGFGADGPYGGLPGYDAVVQAQAGLLSVNGTPEAPVRIGIPLVDLATGLSGVIGIVMALYERERSGQGQRIDLTLYDVAVSLLHPQAANHMLSGQRPERVGNAHSNISPYDVFPTGGADIYIAAGNDGSFRKLCTQIGAEALLADPRFADHPARNRNRTALRDALIVHLRAFDGETLASDLMAAGVPAGAVMEVPEVLAHPHTKHRGMVGTAEGVAVTGNPVALTRTPPDATRRRPPRFAEHTDEILAEHGFSAGEIVQLKASGALPEAE